MRLFNFKKPFEFHSFSEIFYFGTTRTWIWFFLYNANTHKLFQETKIWHRVCLSNIYEILDCGMARLWDMNLDALIQSQYTELIFKKENYGTVSVKEIFEISKCWCNILFHCQWSVKSFINLRGNFYIPCLLLTIMLCLTCDGKKIWCNIEKSKNIMTMMVDKQSR